MADFSDGFWVLDGFGGYSSSQNHGSSNSRYLSNIVMFVHFPLP